MGHVTSMQDESGGRVGRRRAYRTIGVCLTFSLLPGCTQLGPAEKQTLQQANQLYGKGDLSGACSRLDRLIAEHDHAMEIAEAYYLRGLCRVRARQFGPAAKDFETAIRKSQRDDLTLSAQVSLGSLAYQRGDWAGAADLFEEVLPKMALRPPKDDVLFMAGLAMQRIGKWKEATIC
ncbi:MAG TPA: tetratricopeptide repeat protein, partial [Phycisphaerae bacterium]|nr:tetratricopeptide repeat protein [Phycisphaerae bacterium]